MPPPGELSLSQRKTLKAKVCLVGEKAVGKTSLIRRFVLNTFDDRYITTIGTKVSKKEITVWKPEEGIEWAVDMTVWDIMGEQVADAFGAKFVYTSAKTGHNVEKAFQALADVICTNHLAARK